MAEPKIYTRNYVDENTIITVSSNDAEKDNIWDYDKDSQWISSGENNDATQISIQVQFFEAGNAKSQTVDRVILLNHNFEDITVEYWDGSTWQSFASAASQTVGNIILSGSSVSTERIRVLCSATQSANQEKELGQLIVTQLQYDIGTEITEYDVDYRQKVNEIELGDGKVQRTVIKHSPNRSHKYEARATFRFLTSTQIDQLRLIKESGVPFLWQPESTERIDEIYYVHWDSPLRYQYTSQFKGAGFNLEMMLKEV